MDAFEACRCCARHIKKVETTCPFCGAAHTSHAPSPPRRRPRVSRGAWLATTLASSIAIAGCSSTSPSDPGGGAGGTGSDTGSDAKADHSSTDAASDGGAIADAARDADADAGDDAEAEAGWHTCYGAPPARLERAGIQAG
ncbi:MAG: hypothetical protein ACRELB_21775 [Polyangiaceae bacterium]